MFRKTIFVAPCATLAFFALAMFSGGASAQVAGTLDKIKDSGELTIGYQETSLGFSYLSSDAKPVGYSMDICGKIVDSIRERLHNPSIKVRYQAVTSANRIPLVQNGTVDLVCGSSTNLVERQKLVAFSPDIFRYNIRMAVRADSGIKEIGDLKGKTVVTTAGTTSLRLLREASSGHDLDITTLAGKDHADSFLLLQSGRAQAFVLDDILLAGQIANAPDSKIFKITGQSLRTENYALMYRKDDPAFRDLIDGVVTGMMKSGDLKKLYMRWFMSPIPPKNININYPMNVDTQDAFAHPTSKGI